MKELGSPPDRKIDWEVTLREGVKPTAVAKKRCIRNDDGIDVYTVTGQTAAIACGTVGILLSEVLTIEPKRVMNTEHTTGDENASSVPPVEPEPG